MGVLNWLGEVFGSWRQGASDASTAAAHDELFRAVNPATGLPMMGPGVGGVDVAGNPYGVELGRLHGHHGGAFGHDHWARHDPLGSAFGDRFGGSIGDAGSTGSFGSPFDHGSAGSTSGGQHGSD